jgi:hypothetical protein
LKGEFTDDSVYARTLARAVQIVGGVDVLAVHLGVEEHTLNLWLLGLGRPRPDVFFDAVDIVIEDTVRRGITEADPAAERFKD